MPLQSPFATTLTSLLVILAAVTVSASDWKPSVKPASSVTPVAFQEPVAAPEFEPEDSDVAPPFLPPIPQSESVGKAETSASEADVDLTSAPLEVPDFESGNPVSNSLSEVAGESPEAASVEKENADRKVSGESKLKLSDAAEDSEELVKPVDWLGRWNMSSMDWVLRNGSNGIGFFSLTGDAPSWEFDLDSDKEGLEIDFGTGIHFVDGPGHAGSDLPPRLFDIFWNTRFKAETDYGFGIDANFKMGLFTDFEDSVREGWRFPGRLLAYADLGNSNDEIGRVVAGFEYLDLEQTEILPAGGIIFEPNPDTKIDLYFPRPQIRFRVDQEESSDQWLYFRGEYHGSAWAIERDAGNADVVSLTEYRASIGLESIPSDQEESSSFLEVGFLFNRDLEYRSGIGNFQPNDTIIIRLGSRY
jgi:hypothetical protein